MSPQDNVVLEVVGEGKTDFGTAAGEEAPARGVVPILVHKLCGKPAHMRVKRKGFALLQGKGLVQKVQFAKRQAFCNGSQGLVFVLDAEGGAQAADRKLKDLQAGRDSERSEFPAAVGVAVPCIEAWLLTDKTAIRRALDLPISPDVPEEPEKLPAPCEDDRNNAKKVLAACREGRRELSAAEKDRIALAMNDLDLVRQRCPTGFAPFVAEVETRIRPLFAT